MVAARELKLVQVHRIQVPKVGCYCVPLPALSIVSASLHCWLYYDLAV